MIGRCYVLINDRRAGSRWSAGRQLNSPDVLAESSPFLRRLVISIFKLVRKIHRPVTLHGDTAGSRGVCSLLLDSSRKNKNQDLWTFDRSCIFMISDKSSPLLNRLISIFKDNRLIHRPVTLHGDTAGSRGVCSLLLDTSRKTRTRIYGCLIDAVVLWFLTNPYPSSLEGRLSLSPGGWPIERSLFKETQLGPGESALSFWTLL